MEDTRDSSVVGAFGNRSAAERAANELRRAGFGKNQVGIIARGEQGTSGETAPVQTQSCIPDGAVSGAVSGGLLGGILGAGAALLLPGLGPATVGSVVAMALVGAALGAAIGSL